jgi:hypothetical protein
MRHDPETGEELYGPLWSPTVKVVQDHLEHQPEAVPNFLYEMHSNTRGLAIIVAVSREEFEAALDRHGDAFRGQLIHNIRSFIADHAKTPGAPSCPQPPRRSLMSKIQGLFSRRTTR